MIKFIDAEYRVGNKEYTVKDFVIKEHEGLIVIQGPNGIGKTMFLNHLVGVYKLKKGRVNRNYKSKELTYIPDEIIDISEKKLIENIKWIITDLYNVSDEKEILEIAKYLELTQFLFKKTKELSFGTRKKINIFPIFSKTVEQQAKLYIFDEIFTGLDAETQDKVKKRILYLLKKDKTIIIVDHSKELINEIINNVENKNYINISKEGVITYEK